MAKITNIDFKYRLVDVIDGVEIYKLDTVTLDDYSIVCFLDENGNEYEEPIHEKK